uniref:Rab-like protein 3 n=1 Tax=Phallusia mammillata TaxID=59560 RepID=A0A6F9DPM7_9ASCI|nr:rab-like protein 3 [Phallusia mammillata]
MTVVDRNLKVKVLVLGDSGVGKSSFTHLLCHETSCKNPAYTIGCNVEIKLHDYKQGTPEERTCCVEVWDIGASKSHTSSRFIFYNNVNGIILVHDLTNLKSLQNLPRWLDDVLNQEPSGGLSSVKVASSTNSFPMNQADDIPVTHSIPIFMIGTKLDLIAEGSRTPIVLRSKTFSVEFGCGEIHLESAEPKYIAAGSGNAVKLSRFFDKVVEHAIQRQNTTSIVQSPIVDRRGSFGSPADRKTGAERRRPNTSQFNRLISFKNAHQD